MDLHGARNVKTVRFGVHGDARNSGFVVTVGSNVPRNARRTTLMYVNGGWSLLHLGHGAGRMHLAGLLLTVLSCPEVNYQPLL